MNSHRGLSTVVGAIFMIIALSSVIAYITLSMNTVEEFANSILQNEQANQNKFDEEFEITKVKIDNNKFDITLQNNGNIPISIQRLWVENKSATDWITKYNIEKNIPPGGVLNAVGQNLDLTAKDTNSYKLRFITERGNAKEALVNYSGEEPLDLKLFAFPETVTTEFTTTLLLAVTNNMSKNTVLLDLTPTLSPTGGAAQETYLEGPTPSSSESLSSGDTAYFKWVYRLSGDGGNSETFQASLVNGFPGNTVSETVTIEEIAFSLQSGTAIESQGLTTSLTSDDILILHEETQDALGGRQLYSGSPENPVSLDTSVTQNFFWFTKNDTLSDVDVPAGSWNTVLRFTSKEVPDIVPSPDFIHHFGSDLGDPTDDSGGSNRDLTLPGTASDPTLGVSFGRDGTTGYNFDPSDSEYLEAASAVSSGVDDIGSYPDSTSGWFRVSTQSDDKKVIYRVGDGEEFYEIAIGDGTSQNAGKVIFKYITKASDNPPQGDCKSSSRFDDGNWHHFVAVRDGAHSCQLYVDGSPNGQDTSGCQCTGQGGDDVEPTGKANVGRNPETNNEWFDGDLDQIFHWNNQGLTQDQVTAMYNANFGDDAHVFDFKIERWNEDGTILRETIDDSTNYSIKFWDTGGDATAWSDMTRNYTATTSTSEKFANGDRLKFTMNWKSGLNMTIRIDDPDQTDPQTSFMQIPIPDEPFPSYFVYDNDDFPEVNIFNQGPNGSWVTYLTRATFDDISSDNSYAAHINEACGTSMDNSKHIRGDSPLIRVGETCTLQFEQPRNPPDAQASGSTNLIPPGQYRMNLFLSGYDESGDIFLRTVFIGTVRVVE